MRLPHGLAGEADFAFSNKRNQSEAARRPKWPDRVERVTRFELTSHDLSSQRGGDKLGCLRDAYCARNDVVGGYRYDHVTLSM